MDYQFSSVNGRIGSIASGRLYIGRVSSSNWACAMGGSYNTSISGGNGNRHIFETRAEGFYVDDSKKWSASFNDTTYITIYLFALNNNGALQLQHSARCYEVKIFESGSLVKHFIPCYRKADTEIGLYDLIGRQFYTNLGSGTFLKGNDVN